jgi:hypothetical protein
MDLNQKIATVTHLTWKRVELQKKLTELSNKGEAINYISFGIFALRIEAEIKDSSFVDRVVDFVKKEYQDEINDIADQLKDLLK